MREARVKAACVQAALRRAGARPKPKNQKHRDPMADEAVAVIAERADYSARTIYRILAYPPNHLLDIYSADRLLGAAGSHLRLEHGCEVIE